MFGFKKSPLHRLAKHTSADPPLTRGKVSDPFDSDDELDTKKTLTSAKRTSSDPPPKLPSSTTNHLEDDYDAFGSQGFSSTSTKYSLTYAQRNKYKNEFRDTGGLENQNVQELESYAAYKSEETTNTVNNCLKIAEDIRGEATKTLITLHEQGEQITRTHMTVTELDHDLSRGEKLLGSLGGMFSKTWKPKSRKLTGPVITRDDPVRRKVNHLVQKEKLGLVSAPNVRPKSRTPLPEPTNALQKVEYEKAKQDEGLSGLSNLLGELKEMAIEMGTELNGHNGALRPLENDVDKVVIGVKKANKQGLWLLHK